MKQPKFWRRWEGLFTEKRVAVLCAAVLAVSLLPVAWIAQYNHPCSDDYTYGLYVAQVVREGGSLGEVLQAAWRKTAETYGSWQGTFVAVFLMALQPAAFGEGFYAVTPFLMIGMVLGGTFFLLKEVCVRRLGMSPWAWVATASVLGFFMVHFSPNAFEGYFWYNGSLFYTFFHGGMLFALGLLLKFLRLPRGGRTRACGIGAGVLFFLLGGGNYPTALLTAVLLAAALGWALWKRLPLSRRVGAGCFLALELAALAVSMLAPGNSERQAQIDGHPGPVSAIVLAVGASMRYFTRWTTLPLLLALLFLCPLFCKYAARLSFRFPLPLVPFLGAVCVLGIVLTPSIYAMGNTGAGRMQALYYNLFCLLAAGMAFYLCGWATHRPGVAGALKQGKAGTAFALAVILPFAMAVATMEDFTSLTGVAAGLSLAKGEAQAYNAQVEAQLEILEDPTVSDAVLEPLTYRPVLLMPRAVPVLSQDPENETNRNTAAYYGKDTVRVAAQGE